MWGKYKQALLCHNADCLRPCSSKECDLVSKLFFFKLVQRCRCAFHPPAKGLLGL